MPLWLLWLLPAYEAGIWTSAFGFRGLRRKHVEDVLLHGKESRTSLQFIDRQLKRTAGSPTRSQAYVARFLTRGLRWCVNTHAFEYAILLSVKRCWPRKVRGIDSKV